jgi:hypothetical protein
MTLLAAATLTSQLNGVTKTDGTGGTFSDFTQLRASGQQAKYATVTGGVEGSHAIASTYAGSWSSDIAWFHPDNIYLNDDPMTGVTFDYVNRTFSVAIPDSAGSNIALVLGDSDPPSNFQLDTITISAAASGVKSNRLGLGLGGLGL